MIEFTKQLILSFRDLIISAKLCHIAFINDEYFVISFKYIVWVVE